MIFCNFGRFYVYATFPKIASIQLIMNPEKPALQLKCSIIPQSGSLKFMNF